jgi:hypothetical protein
VGDSILGTPANCCPFQKNFSDIPYIHSVGLIRALSAESNHRKYVFTRSSSSSDMKRMAHTSKDKEKL